MLLPRRNALAPRPRGGARRIKVSTPSSASTASHTQRPSDRPAGSVAGRAPSPDGRSHDRSSAVGASSRGPVLTRAGARGRRARGGGDERGRRDAAGIRLQEQQQPIGAVDPATRAASTSGRPSAARATTVSALHGPAPPDRAGAADIAVAASVSVALRPIAAIASNIHARSIGCAACTIAARSRRSGKHDRDGLPARLGESGRAPSARRAICRAAASAASARRRSAGPATSSNGATAPAF